MRLVFQVPKNLFCIGFGVRCYELSPTNIVWRKHLTDLPIFRTVARMRWPTTTTLAEPRQLPWPVEARRVIMRLCFAEVEAAPGPDLAAPPAPCECCAMLRR